jgi:O-antigen/teichoic acid export membrane protein
MFGLTALVNADIIGLKYFSPAPVAEQLAGVYQAAVTLARIPIFLTLALFSAVFPYVAYRTARDQSADIYARLALKYTLLFVVPLNVIFVAEPDPIIRVFFSSAYDASSSPLAAASLGTILMTLVHGFAILLQASGRVMLTTVVLPIGVAVEVLALAWLVPMFGGIGAGLALVTAGVLLLLILAPIALRSYAIRLPVGAIVGYCLSLGALIAALYLAPHEGRLETLSGIVVAGLIYLLALIIVGALSPDDVRILANGLGPRGAVASVRLQQIVQRLNVLPIAR